jgi:hypothetical protein
MEGGPLLRGTRGGLVGVGGVAEGLDGNMLGVEVLGIAVAVAVAGFAIACTLFG